MTDPRLSQHPVDILIRQIIAGVYRPSESDIDQVIERIATAPFDERPFRVPPELIATTEFGLSLGVREPSLIIHYARRLLEEQWTVATTVAEYLADLREAVRGSDSRLGLYLRRGGNLAVSIRSTALTVPTERRGVDAQPSILVIYSADRGVIVSGYRFSELSTVAIPGDATWLK
jgi:hypothetical protein